MMSKKGVELIRTMRGRKKHVRDETGLCLHLTCPGPNRRQARRLRPPQVSDKNGPATSNTPAPNSANDTSLPSAMRAADYGLIRGIPPAAPQRALVREAAA